MRRSLSEYTHLVVMVRQMALLACVCAHPAQYRSSAGFKIWFVVVAVLNVEIQAFGGVDTINGKPGLWGLEK